MKKLLLLALALLLIPAAASAQCNGVFANNTACGNISGGSNLPRAIPLSSFPAALPGGSNGQVQYNNAGAFGGYTNTQLTALINTFTSLLSGAVPASGGGTTNFLRADGTWTAPPGTGVASFNARTGVVTSAFGDYPIALGGTGLPNVYSWIGGLQPLKLTTAPGNIIGVNPGFWSNNTGTVTYSTTNNTNATVPNYGDMTADLSTATVNWTSVPQPTGGQVSGALSKVGATTNGTEVFLYLIHRNSDSRVALIGSSSDTISGAAYTFTATVAAPGVLTCTQAPCSTGAGHGLRQRMAIYLSNSGGALPAPFGTGVQYYVCTVPSTTSITLATSIANVNTGTCLTTTTAGSGTNTMSWGVQRDLDFQLGASIATVDRRYPYFATVWQSGWDYIPNFTTPPGSTRTLLTGMDLTASYCVSPGAVAPYTAISFSHLLNNINRQALFRVSCAGGASGGTCLMRTTSTTGNVPVVTAAAGATNYGSVELVVDSVGQVDHAESGTATGTYCVQGWSQMDPS